MDAGLTWHERSRRDLIQRLEALRPIVQQAGAPAPADEPVAEPAASIADEPLAFDKLRAVFRLNRYETQLLLLAAGVEVDHEIRAACGAANAGIGGAHLTVALAAAWLGGHQWEALAPSSSLRRWRLVELAGQASMADTPLRIDERILHYLMGVPYVDPRLQPLVKPQRGPRVLPSSHQQISLRIQRAWSASDQYPVIELFGDHGSSRDIAAYACEALGLRLWRMSADDLPLSAYERELLCRLWEREAALLDAALLLDARSSESLAAVRGFVDSLNAPLLVLGSSGESERSRVSIQAPRLSPIEQVNVWREALGPHAALLNGRLEVIAGQFDLGIGAIETASHSVVLDVAAGADVESALLGACRRQGGSALDGLAQRMDKRSGWDDLVLPAVQQQVLRAIVAQVRQRMRVYESWGFGSRVGSARSVTALFSGEPGTGKTMAAEVLAADLGLDLFRIDVSQAVSKYIGETEKNLARVFDAAERSGAILLFDEADALFGRRTTVGNSNDRYANLEVSYLLQRMETYRGGLAILTSNLKSSIDEGFQRRLRFIVDFPFPDAGLRAEIWRRAFPAATPTKDLDFDKLSRLRVPGGSIRNIALNAAFLAADAGDAVGMMHLQQAAHLEYAKRDRTCNDAEIGGWV